MSRIDASRRPAADPASVALLLAGPAAVEAWPADGGRIVTANPPTRFGTGFGLRLEIRADAAGVAQARLTVMPSVHPDGRVRCELRITMSCDDALADDLKSEADSYLDTLVMLAECRATAA